MGKSKAVNESRLSAAPDEERAREAVRMLIRWAGDDPDRPALRGTPERVLAFYREFFRGYAAQARDYAASVAEGTRYKDFILIRDISIASFCEHHMLPAAGMAHIAYIPGEKVAGIGAVARLAADCASRFTTQESLTDDIGRMMCDAFAPRGSAVLTELSHGCMALRGARQERSRVTACSFSGLFLDNRALREQFLIMVNEKGGA